jgi:hypothetical protein
MNRFCMWALAAWVMAMTLLIVALFLFTSPVKAADLALGDSLALGFGQASHMTINAKVGISSCAILARTPTDHYDFVLLSAGTNDPPGRCVAAIRARLNASHVMWVVPVNGARGTVLATAKVYQDQTLVYTPGRRSWPHPQRYWNVRK